MSKINELKEIIENKVLEVRENNTIKVVKISELGAAFFVNDGELLYSVPMLMDNTLDWENVGEVTAPQNQAALDEINTQLYTHFKMSQFSGR